MTLMYLRENRTYFHIGHAYGINASTAYRITRHVEDTLSKEEAFKLPSKRQLQEGGLEQRADQLQASQANVVIKTIARFGVMLQESLPNETQIMRGLRNLEENYGQATKNVERRGQGKHRAGGSTRRRECG